jgi:hypothetical protein
VKVLYLYVDFTFEDQPFYVGKGDASRVRGCGGYNREWNEIREALGQRRRVLMCTKDESFAFEQERRLIVELRTKSGESGHWGANQTWGGEGASGANRSEETRKRQSISALRAYQDPSKKSNHDKATRLAKQRSEWRLFCSKRFRGKVRSLEEREAIRKGTIRFYSQRGLRPVLPTQEEL